MGNQVVLLKNGKSRYRVPTYVRSDDGEILYRSRFFIDPTFKDDCEAKKGQLEKTVKAQQTVIERMAEQIKCLEESKQETQSEHYELVSLLHDKDDQIKSLLEKEKKYKLLLMKYMN